MVRTGARPGQLTSPNSGPQDGLSEGPQALFVYGTLQFPEILFVLIDRVPERRPAAAEGWRVASLTGRVYPGLVPGDGAAHGHLLSGLTSEEWRVLDAFEGPEYELKRLELVGGGHGWAYVWRLATEVSSAGWSAEDFEQRHLPAYVKLCTAWRRHHDAAQAG